MFTANRLHEMDPVECMVHLQNCQYHVGRIAFGHDVHGLTILPVNFVLDNRRLVIRTGDGAIWKAARAGARAAFEVDSLSGDRPPRPHEWSVVVRGRLATVDDADELTFLRLSQLDPAAGGLKPRFVTMDLQVMTGRRT